MNPLAKHAAAGLLALAAVAGLAAPASAHAKLVKSDPPQNGQPSDKTDLELTFSETLSGKLSGADVVDAAGKTVPASSMLDQNNKGLMIMLADPLKPGAYKVNWHAVSSDDGHRTTGVVDFSVK
jgi:methionine-rich copper-binding protein CopC